MGDSKLIRFEACPQCRDEGRDTSGNNLAVYDDGHSNCFACGYQDQPNGKTMQKTVVTLPQSAPFPTGGWKKKGINTDTLERFSVVRVAKLDADGCPVYERYEDGSFTVAGSTTVAFPYFDGDTGELIAYKSRDLAAEVKREGIKWHDYNDKVSLFGLSTVSASATVCVLTEGESDALSVAQAMPDVAVFGVSGAASVKQALTRSSHILRKFRKVIIGFDNDEAGAKYTAEAIPMLPKGKTWVANIPAKFKDWNEVLLAGGAEAIKTIMRNCTQVKSSNLVTSDELYNTTWEQLKNREQGGTGYSTGFLSLDSAIGGLTPGKLTTIVSGTGAGKSLLCEQITTNAIANHEDLTVLFVPLEMTISQVMERMAQSITGLPVAADPFFHMHMEPEDELRLKQTLKMLSTRVVFPRQDKTVDVNHFCELLEEAVEVYGAKVVVLDHITALSVNEKDGLDWKAVDRTMAKLASMAVRLNVSILTVSHISRDGENEEEVPKLKHIRAGNGIAQYSHCVIGMGRKRSENVATVETIKVDRMIGKWVNFKVSYQNFKLREVKGDDTVSVSEGWEVRQQTGTGHTLDIPGLDTPSRGATEVQDGTQLSPRLSTPERDTVGSEGILHTAGQNKDVSGYTPKPINRLETPLLLAKQKVEQQEQN